MRDTMTTSWRRLSDDARNYAASRGSRSERAPPVQLKEAQSLETWENEGGQSALSTAPVRILIVDDDIKSSDSLELMLNASGYSQTRVAYSGPWLAIDCVDVRPRTRGARACSRSGIRALSSKPIDARDLSGLLHMEGDRDHGSRPES
jgi:hypothetical protein